jgi:hypothetical protein
MILRLPLKSRWYGSVTELRFISVTLLALIFWPQLSLACSLTPAEILNKKRAQTISSSELCAAVLSGIASREVVCADGKGHWEEVTTKVTRRPDNRIVQFDMEIKGPSGLLANIVGGSGYESHKYKIMLFLDFNCVNSYWYYEYEPRYIRASYRAALDDGNKNWRLFSDNDRIVSLSQRIDNWIVAALKGGDQK